MNELRYGMSGGATLFSPDLTAGMFNDTGAGQANQGGFRLNISSAGIANPSAGGGISAREASTKFIENNLNWLRGDHALTMGVNYTNVDVWLLTGTRAGQIAFDTVDGRSDGQRHVHRGQLPRQLDDRSHQRAEPV